MAEVASSPSTPVVVPSRDQSSDPSPRALETLFRESKQLEDKMLLRFDAIQVKFQGYDEAVRLLQAFTARQPTTEAVNVNLEALDKAISVSLVAAEKLSCEKFKGVMDKFTALDLRYDQLDGSNKEAISAALRAAEKAVEKTEVNFTKQIDSLMTLISTTRVSLENNIADIKERVTIIEANKQGIGQAWGVIVSVGALISVAIVVTGFIIARVN